MASNHFTAISIALLILLTLLSSVTHARSGEYRLDAGDTIAIQVFGEADLSFDQILLSDTGNVSYPFLGDIQVSGKTTREVQATITRGLKGDYLIDPKVTVTILSYRNFFVNGEVKSPGGYPFQPGLTIRKAVSLAGGFTERAARSAIFVLRERQTNSDMTKVALDDLVFPGDIITVEESFF